MTVEADVSAHAGAVVAAADAEQYALPCSFMRGGSSRGAFFLDSDLPVGANERAAVLLACYGSPDPRQIDGIGGSDPLTSKAAVVAVSDRADADVSYTFYQVGIERAQVSTGGNCGNMLAAVGPFALLRGLLQPREPETTIRIFVTNTQQVVTARIPVRHGVPACEGDCSVAGVPDPGAPIYLDFGDCAGAVSGTLFPTGNRQDEIVIDGKPVRVSLVDAATPFVFVWAPGINASATESAAAIASDARLLEKLEAARAWAAVRLGLVERASEAVAKSPNIPRVMMVAPPRRYQTPAGHDIDPGNITLCARQLSMQRPHKALAVTGAVCTAVAAAMPGTVVAACAGDAQPPYAIGHPAGVLRVSALTETDQAGQPRVKSAVIERTARLIMDGLIFVRRRKVDQLLQALGAAE